MIRRPSIETKINHERWLVSYSDFITLLFAFFVVMYSVSQVNETKYRTLSETLEHAFNAKDSTKGSESTDRHEITLAALGDIQEQMESALQGVINDGTVTLNGNQFWVEIEIDANAFFASGKAQPSQEARRVLNKVASILAPFDNAVSIAGHTDDLPISNSEFQNNWELSAARAVSVVNLLAFAGVDPTRLSAVGYGEYRPIAPNDTEEGRRANRRVVLRVEQAQAEVPTVSAAESVGAGSSLPASGDESATLDLSVSDDAAKLESEPVSEEGLPETVEPVKLRSGGLLFTSDPERSRNR